MSKVFVFGHQNPDSDAIGSSYGYAYLKRRLGVDAEAVALGTPNEETAFVLDLIILVLKHHEWLNQLSLRVLIRLFLQTIMSFNNLFQILRTLKLLR